MSIKWLARMRRYLHSTFTRGPAMFRRLGIPPSDVDPKKRGLIILQIDGLSYNRLQAALRKRKMPYVRRLLRRGRLRLQPYLSQIPTSTPAFQAGMFYGDNDNIPGFNFYDKRERRYYKMGDSDSAYRVESGFTNPGLLQHGSVFSCVYTGDAEASLFIFSSLLAPRRWRFALRLYDLAVLTFLHVEVVFKIIAMALAEFAVSLYDFIRLVVKRGHFKRELEIVAIRVGLSVISRELITLGAVIDIYRRVPTIYVNFLSYDEHAHLRGPNSRFAMWSLRAIDRCIRRIYMAERYAERDYDIYILSDHGQSATRPFEELSGETLALFLQSQLAGTRVETYEKVDERPTQLHLAAHGTSRIAQNAPWFLRPPLEWFSRKASFEVASRNLARLDPPHDVVVVSTGPVAYAYWIGVAEKLTGEQIEEKHPGLLDRLAAHPCIGFVSVVQLDGTVLVRSEKGKAVISERAVRMEGVLPFTEALNCQHVLDGVRRVTLMQRSGDICIWGGGGPRGDVSFSYEFGAHSGWTDEEVHSFIMAPQHVDFSFARIRRHNEFYQFFQSHYGSHPSEEESEQGFRELTAV